MKRFLVLMVYLLSSFAAAQSLTGSYALTQNGQSLSLQLRDAGGQVTGTLTGDGGTYQLQGRSKGMEAEGTISDGSGQYYFYLKLQGNQLTLVVADFDANNQPDKSTAQQYVFNRQGTSTAPSSGLGGLTSPQPINPAPSASSNLTGVYTVQTQTGTLTLTVRDQNGQVTGTLKGNNVSYSLQGQSSGNGAEGLISNTSSRAYFRLELSGTTMQLTLADLNASGQPDPASERTIQLTRSGNAAPASSSAPQAAADALVGKFSGSGLTLELKGGNGNYTGSILWGGKTYPVKAQGNGNRAFGQFTAGTQTLLFDAQVSGNTMTLAIAGKKYSLARVSAATTSKPSPAPSPAPNTPNPASSVAAPTATSNAELRDGGVYKAGTRVNAKLHGVAFIVPQGFTGQSKDGFALLTNGKGIGALVVPFVGASNTDVVALMSRDIEVSAQVVFKAIGGAQARGNQLLLRYSATTNQGQLVATGIAVFGKGNGVSFVVFSDAAQSAAVDRMAASLAAGVSFSSNSLSQTLETLRRGLGGKYLSFFSYSSQAGGTYTGASDSSSQRTWNLCSDGSYRYQGSYENRYTLQFPDQSQGSTFGSSPDRESLTGTGGDANSGRWHVFVVGNSAALVFFAGDGSVEFHLLSNLERAGGKLPFMDGRELSSFGASNQCR